MTTWRTALMSCGLLAVLGAAVLAQTTGKGTDPIAQLLAEVHELRLVMQRQGADSARIQLLISRLTIQETRVSRLARELDEVRDQLSRLPEEQRDWAEQIKHLEAAVPLVANQEERATLEMQVRAMRRQTENARAREQRLRAREAELDGALGSEQARWLDFSNRLDELERSLAKP